VIALFVMPAKAGIHLDDETWIPAPYPVRGKLCAGMTEFCFDSSEEASTIKERF